MKQVFLIFSNPGSYDCSSVVVGFTTSQQEADDAIFKLKLSYRTALDFYDNTIMPSIRKFREENQDKDIYNCKFEDVPKWPAGMSEKNITPVMREERDAIKQRNQLVLEESSRQAEAYRILEMKYIEPAITLHKDKEWFKKWFDVGKQNIFCSANGLVENNEYYSEPCDEL